MNYIFLAEGFEESEAIIVVDILRRASVDIKTVSIGEDKLVNGAHGIPILCDITFEELQNSKLPITSLIMPGGLPGSTNLCEFTPLLDLLSSSAKGSLIAAICAAPMVLGKIGLLEGKNATCYPGFEEHLKGANYTEAAVEVDGNIITGKGPGAAFEFGFKIAEYLKDETSVQLIRKGMLTV